MRVRHHHVLVGFLSAVIIVGGAWHYLRTTNAAFESASDFTRVPAIDSGYTVNAFAEATDGSYYIGGSFHNVGTLTGPGVITDDASGAIGTFPPITGYRMNVAIPDGSGGWYVGGNFSQVGTFPRDNVAHILADGSVDPDFNPNVGNPNPDIDEHQVYALALEGTTLYVGGWFDEVDDGADTRNYIAAFDAATGDLLPFDPDVDSTVFSIVVSSDGATVYAGGDFNSVNGGGTTRSQLAAFDSTTGIATAFDPDMDATVYSLALSSDDATVYAGGNFSDVNAGTIRYGLAALDAGTGAVSLIDFGLGAFQTVAAVRLSSDDSTLYAAGGFSTVNGGTSRGGLAAFDTVTGTATAFDPANPDQYNSIVLSDDESVLYAGSAVATAYDTATSAPLPWQPDLAFDGQSVSIDALSVAGSQVYVGGVFRYTEELARCGVSHILEDGTPDPAFDADLNCGNVRDLVLSPDGSTLYIGGTSAIDGINGSSLVAVDATTGARATGDFLVWGPAEIFDMDISQDGLTLYVGGKFNFVNLAFDTRNNLAAFDTTTGITTAFDPDVTVGFSGVRSIDLNSDDSLLYIGGQFNTVNGATSRTNLAAFDTTTALATAFDPTTNSAVMAISLSDDDTLLAAAGFFSTIGIGSDPRDYLGVVDIATGAATAFDAGLDSSAEEVLVDGPLLYAGGFFTTVNGGAEARSGLAAFDLTTGTVDGAFVPQLQVFVGPHELYKSDDYLYMGGNDNPGYEASGRDMMGVMGVFPVIGSGGGGGGGGGGSVADADYVLINANAPFTASASVQLSIGGNTFMSGLEGEPLLWVSNFADMSFAATRSFSETITWDLCYGMDPCVGGLRIVYVALGDASDDVAPPSGEVLDDSILFEPGASTAGILIDGGAAQTTARTVTLQLRHPFSSSDAVTMQLMNGPARVGTVTSDLGPILEGTADMPFVASLSGWDLCPGQATCPAGTYQVFAQYRQPLPAGFRAAAIFLALDSMYSDIYSGSIDVVAPSPLASPAPTGVPSGPTTPASPSPTATPVISPTPGITESPQAPILPSPDSAWNAAVEAIAIGAATLATIPVVLFAAQALTGTAGVLGAGQIGGYLFQILGDTFLAAFGLKRKPRIWGRVYDVATKAPIGYAVIELLDESYRVLETRYADADGRYGFLTAPRSVAEQQITLRMRAKARGYEFPVKPLPVEPDYFVFSDLQDGSPFVLSAGSVVRRDIPMQPISTPAAPHSKDRAPLRMVRGIWVGILDVAFWVGLILVPLNFLLAPTLLNGGIVLVFVLSNAIRIRAHLYRRFGLVTNAQGAPVPYALVTAEDGTGARLAWTVSDHEGRFFLLTDKRVRSLTVHAPATVTPVTERKTPFNGRRGWASTRLVLA